MQDGRAAFINGKIIRGTPLILFSMIKPVFISCYFNGRVYVKVVPSPALLVTVSLP